MINSPIPLVDPFEMESNDLNNNENTNDINLKSNSNSNIDYNIGCGGTMLDDDRLPSPVLQNQEYNSPVFLKSSHSSIILSPQRNGLDLNNSSSSNNSSGSNSHNSSIILPSNVSPRLIGFSITRSTSHQSLLAGVLNNNHSPNHHHQQETSHSERTSPHRLLRNEKAKSSPPGSASSSIALALNIYNQQQQQQQYQNQPHNNFIHSHNINHLNQQLLHLKNEQPFHSSPNLTSYSSSTLIPVVEEVALNEKQTIVKEEEGKHKSIQNNNIQASTKPNHSPSSPSSPSAPIVSRSRSNSKTILYSPTRSRSSSLGSQSPTCKLSPPPLTQNQLLPNTLDNQNNINLSNNQPENINNNQNNNNNNNYNLNNINNNNNILKSNNLFMNPLITSPPISISSQNQQQQQQQQQSIFTTPVSLKNTNSFNLSTPFTPSTLSTTISINDFTLIEKIGEGGFGQVYLAKKHDTEEIVALKRMSKDLIWSKNKVTHIKNERDILAQGKNHRYIVSLAYSFQDDQYLYLAMEYVPGGDLRSLLSALGALEEENAKFYMAEMVEAVDSCHRLGYCHRDLKPENFLIDRTGHIKLADFGLSKNVITRYVKAADYKGTPNNSMLSTSAMEHTPMKFGSSYNNLNSSGILSSSVTDFNAFGSFKDINIQTRLAYSVVGSPFYMAPEVLQATKGYGDEVDWWSLGCMFYEFIVGIPPFDGESPEEVMDTVIKWKTNLKRPQMETEGVEISDELWDLITKLICDGPQRLGTGDRGVENIKQHPFFAGTSFGKLHENEPPFVPLLEDDFDTSYFEKDRTTVAYTNRTSGSTVISKSKPSRNILGFTYPRAGEDPLVWANMLKNLMINSSENINNTLNPLGRSSNSLKISTSSLTPPNMSPTSVGSMEHKQDPASPYGSYNHKSS